jgi:hypothetical protein
VRSVRKCQVRTCLSFECLPRVQTNWMSIEYRAVDTFTSYVIYHQYTGWLMERKYSIRHLLRMTSAQPCSITAGWWHFNNHALPHHSTLLVGTWHYKVTLFRYTWWANEFSPAFSILNSSPKSSLIPSITTQQGNTFFSGQFRVCRLIISVCRFDSNHDKNTDFMLRVWHAFPAARGSTISSIESASKDDSQLEDWSEAWMFRRFQRKQNLYLLYLLCIFQIDNRLAIISPHLPPRSIPNLV